VYDEGNRPITPPYTDHPATPHKRRLHNLWSQHRPRFRRAPFPKPRPDFTEVEVVLAQAENVAIGRFGDESPWPDGNDECLLPTREGQFVLFRPDGAGPYTASITGSTVPPAVIPEPNTLVLVATGGCRWPVQWCAASAADPETRLQDKSEQNGSAGTLPPGRLL
jgi:hypothetical protein